MNGNHTTYFNHTYSTITPPYTTILAKKISCAQLLRPIKVSGSLWLPTSIAPFILSTPQWLSALANRVKKIDPKHNAIKICRHSKKFQNAHLPIGNLFTLLLKILTYAHMYVVFETCGTSFWKIKLFWVCGSQSCFEFVWMFVYVTVSALHSTKKSRKIAILRCHNAVSLVSRNKSLS